MPTPRKLLVDPRVTRLYHCISKCVRHAQLCGPGHEHRKQWIETRLEELVSIFSIDVCGYSVLDNHLHTVVRLDPDRVKSWTNREVAERWWALYPKRDRDGKPLPVLPEWVLERASKRKWVKKIRTRLASLSWFMKCLKEPLARQANREEKVTGAFWAARFKSIAILDEESLLATCAYVDLNPVAAGIASTPEESAHTSIRSRVEHCRKHGVLADLVATPFAQAHAERVAAVEQSHWLCPMEDRRAQGSRRDGLLPGFSLRSYLQLVDWTSRLYREGKARVHRDVRGILERLGATVGAWEKTLRRLLSGGKLVGTAFGGPASLKALAAARGQRWVNNLVGRPA